MLLRDLAALSNPAPRDSDPEDYDAGIPATVVRAAAPQCMHSTCATCARGRAAPPAHP